MILRAHGGLLRLLSKKLSLGLLWSLTRRQGMRQPRRVPVFWLRHLLLAPPKSCRCPIPYRLPFWLRSLHWSVRSRLPFLSLLLPLPGRGQMPRACRPRLRLLRPLHHLRPSLQGGRKAACCRLTCWSWCCRNLFVRRIPRRFLRKPWRRRLQHRCRSPEGMSCLTLKTLQTLR